MSYQKLFISRPSEGTKPWPKFLAQKSLKKAKNNLKNLEKTKKNRIPGLLQKQKSKKPRENQKNQKNQKSQYSRTLAKVKMQKSKKPRENQKKPKKPKKPMFQDSCLLTLSPDFWNIGFFGSFGFFWFSRGFLDFCIFTFARVLEYCFF